MHCDKGNYAAPRLGGTGPQWLWQIQERAYHLESLQAGLVYFISGAEGVLKANVQGLKAGLCIISKSHCLNNHTFVRALPWKASDDAECCGLSDTAVVHL